MNYLKRLEMQLIVGLCLITVGCAEYRITVEPVPKTKPVTHYAAKKKKHANPHQTPTPTPKLQKQPLHLEPTDRPTPMIKVDKVTQLNLSTQPLL